MFIDGELEMSVTTYMRAKRNDNWVKTGAKVQSVSESASN